VKHGCSNPLPHPPGPWSLRLTFSEKQQEEFIQELEAFFASRHQAFKRTPSLNFHDMDLFKLFRYVEHCGGSRHVSANEQWHIVAQALGFDESLAVQLEASYSRCGQGKWKGRGFGGQGGRWV
jgi:hypothetical protein